MALGAGAGSGAEQVAGAIALAPRLDDLDARGIAVGVCDIGEESRFSGERIGGIRGRALMVWMK